MTPKAIRKYLS